MCHRIINEKEKISLFKSDISSVECLDSIILFTDRYTDKQNITLNKGHKTNLSLDSEP